jgi:hypothetical protein
MAAMSGIDWATQNHGGSTGVEGALDVRLPLWNAAHISSPGKTDGYSAGLKCDGHLKPA